MLELRGWGWGRRFCDDSGILLDEVGQCFRAVQVLGRLADSGRGRSLLGILGGLSNRSRLVVEMNTSSHVIQSLLADL